MPETKSLPVKDLDLDLENYRTIHQSSEKAAIEAMVATSADWFWALVESLADDGYLPTENIIVLRGGDGKTQTVREGNRRVAALKILLGLLPTHGLAAPTGLSGRIAKVSAAWRSANATVPCLVYDQSDKQIVDKIVTLAHGKGEKAGRNQWNAIARARHNREVNSASEPALDLLEKYLQHGKNVTSAERSRWSGDYPLTVLAEAGKKLASRVGCKSASDVAEQYPNINHRDVLESIIHAIGRDELGFGQLRQEGVDFAAAYGMPAAAPSGSSTTPSGKKAAKRKGPSRKPKARTISDPLAVRRLLRGLALRGPRREKVEALRREAISLNLHKTPLAFCFVLRSMFEISAKVYGKEQGIALTDKNGRDRSLVELLRDATRQLTNNNQDQAMVKALHGAMTDLAKRDGLLSVTSMNQLVHNTSFSVSPTEIARLFGNIFPLLEAMSS